MNDSRFATFCFSLSAGIAIGGGFVLYRWRKAIIEDIAEWHNITTKEAGKVFNREIMKRPSTKAA